LIDLAHPLCYNGGGISLHDIVIEVDHWSTSHLFVVDCPEELVAGGVHVAVPWHWVRGIEDVVILRWFPPTPIPEDPVNP